MGDAVWAIPNFLGGEISTFAQGRFDKPDYRTSLSVCLNAFPVEIGTWTRRPGSKFFGTTRGGAPGRVVKFDFTQSVPHTIEFTDGYLRFRSSSDLIASNDPQLIVGVSAANPAVVQTSANHNWSSGNTIQIGGNSEPLLQRRQFKITVTDATHFSLQDALTGDDIDGATLTVPANAFVAIRVLELASPYAGGSWATIRTVQAETTDILLCGTVPPQAVTVTALPNPAINAYAEFAIRPAIFNDGPYLDPFTNGVQATPSATVGIVSLALDFPAYSSTKAYRTGDFASNGGVNYRSLADQNVGHSPGGGPPWWVATTAGAAINDGRGFLGSDVGRLVRLFSEPLAWAVGTTYAATAVVSYNPTGLPGATTYWQSQTGGNVGNVPGANLTSWTIVPSGASLWSWGRITSLTNTIDRAPAGSVNFGNMTGGGGLAAAFDGVFSQVAAASAQLAASGGAVTVSTVLTQSAYVGKDYSAASDQVIEQATVYPSSDQGFAYGTYNVSPFSTPIIYAFVPIITLNLRGKATPPASASDGTLLGTSEGFFNTTAPVTIVSTDQATAWKYVWIEQVSLFQIGGGSDAVSYSYATAIAEVSFFSPTGTGTGEGVNVEILGPPLLNTSPIQTWRLGVYSATTGYPTCGTYYEGRLWLGGAVPNRFDASVSNGIDGGTVNFAPTDQNGVVAANAAISYTLNSDSSNPIFWMQADLAGILMGTQAAEFLVQAPTTGPLAPANIAARRVTKHGSANVEPRRTEHTLVFVKRYGRKLLEFFSDANFGKFSAPNLADKAGHIISAGIAEIAYTEAVAPVIWGRDGNGSLFGVTYKRDIMTTSQPPTFAAWHRHALGSGRIVESLCSGPSSGGNLDALTMVTNDPATGIRHVEILTDTPDENTELADSWFLDDAVAPASTAVVPASVAAPYGGLTINGLWHLNGETVQVFAGGLDCGDRGPGTTGFTDFLVANGSCLVPFGDSISSGPGRGLFTADFAATASIVVGFTYNSDGQLVRPIAPADTGARNGPALGKTRRNNAYSVLVSNTPLGIEFGGAFGKTFPALFRQTNGNQIVPLTAFSGVHHDALSDDYSMDGMVCWRVSRPWPANIVAISGSIQTQDR